MISSSDDDYRTVPAGEKRNNERSLAPAATSHTHFTTALSLNLTESRATTWLRLERRERRGERAWGVKQAKVFYIHVFECF